MKNDVVRENHVRTRVENPVQQHIADDVDDVSEPEETATGLGDEALVPGGRARTLV